MLWESGVSLKTLLIFERLRFTITIYAMRHGAGRHCTMSHVPSTVDHALLGEQKLTTEQTRL
jgi:hypothetical protein